MHSISNSVIQEIETPLKKIVGEYEGKWGGYRIDFYIGNKHYTFGTKDGVRGFDIPVKILITETEISFNTIR